MARPRRLRRDTRLAEYRAASGLTQEQVAERLRITPEMVRRHERGISYPEERSRRRYCALYRASETALGLGETSQTSAADDIAGLVAEITESNTSNSAIELLDRGAASLAQLHTRAPARNVLDQVGQLRANAHALLRGPIRLSQVRDIYRIESELLAHSCMLLSDLKHFDQAYSHGMAGLAFATEAGSSEAIVRSALAKTLRWEERLIESVDMARAGYERSPRSRSDSSWAAMKPTVLRYSATHRGRGACCDVLRTSPMRAKRTPAIRYGRSRRPDRRSSPCRSQHKVATSMAHCVPQRWPTRAGRLAHRWSRRTGLRSASAPPARIWTEAISTRQPLTSRRSLIWRRTFVSRRSLLTPQGSIAGCGHVAFRGVMPPISCGPIYTTSQRARFRTGPEASISEPAAGETA